MLLEKLLKGANFSINIFNLEESKSVSYTHLTLPTNSLV